MQTPLADLLNADNGDAECCMGFCRHVFLRKAYDLTWDFVDSIANDGLIDPIKVSVEDGEVFYLRNGNHRFAAALLLAIGEVPTESGGYDSNDGPSGWPSGDGRLCFHDNPDPAVYIMADPAFAAIISDVADGISDCGFDPYLPSECCEGFCYDCYNTDCQCTQCDCGNC